MDKERAHREGFKFGAKLVRGAYMFMENERAKQKGYPSPVWPSKQDTHDNYDRCCSDILLPFSPFSCMHAKVWCPIPMSHMRILQEVLPQLSDWQARLVLALKIAK